MTQQFSRRQLLRTAGLGIGAAALAGVAGCGSGAKSSGNPSTIKWAGFPHVLNKDPFEIREIEKRFGLTLSTYPVSWGDYLTKMQANLTGGDIPDVMWINDPEPLQKFASQGVIAEVPREKIAQYAPRLVAAIDKGWSQGWFYGRYRGANYGFPMFYNGQYSSLTAWRTDLLEKAGVSDLPQTLDDVEAAFEALKGIGVYGMTTIGTSYYAQFMTIFGAHGVMPMAWQLVNGSIINGAVRPEAKTALERLAGWYKKGYIDTEFASNQNGAQQQKFAAGKVAMFDYAGPSDNDPKNPTSLITAARKTNAKASIDFSPPPQGPGGRGSWAWGSAGHVMMFGRQIAKDDAKLKRILGVFETVLTDVEFGTRMALGDEGTMYEVTDKSQGIAGGWRWIGDYTDPNRTDAEGLGAYPYVGMPDPSIITNVNVPDPSLRKISEDYGKYTYVDYFGKSGVVEGSDQYAANLQNLKVKAYSDIVTGARPVGAFDDFVHQWNAAGGEQLRKAADKLRQEVPTKGN